MNIPKRDELEAGSLKDLETLRAELDEILSAKREKARQEFIQSVKEMAESEGFTFGPELFGWTVSTEDTSSRSLEKQAGSAIPDPIYVNPDNHEQMTNGKGPKEHWEPWYREYIESAGGDKTRLKQLKKEALFKGLDEPEKERLRPIWADYKRKKGKAASQPT